MLIEKVKGRESENYTQDTCFYHHIAALDCRLDSATNHRNSACSFSVVRESTGLRFLWQMGMGVAALINKLQDPTSTHRGICSYAGTFVLNEDGSLRWTKLWINPNLPYGIKKRLEEELLK